MPRPCHKHAHPSFREAVDHVLWLKKRDGDRDPRKLDIYRCKWCGSWHVGHNSRRTRKEIRGDLDQLQWGHAPEAWKSGGPARRFEMT